MGRRVNWSRARKARAAAPEKRALERAADRIIARAEHQQPVVTQVEHKAYRCVGSVMFRDGLWHALDGEGKVAGSFRTRMEAWMLADKFGMTPIELAAPVREDLFAARAM